MSYTITCDSDGGIQAIYKVATDNQNNAYLYNPQKYGYTFNGWFLDDGTQVDATTKYTEDTTVKAKWTLDSGGGGANSHSIKLVNNNNIQATLNKTTGVKGQMVSISYTTPTEQEIPTNSSGVIARIRDDEFNIIPYTNKNNKIEFYMPDNNVTVTLMYGYDITYNVESGLTSSINFINGGEGERIIVDGLYSSDLNTDKVVLKVTDSNGNKVPYTRTGSEIMATFNMPADKVTVSVEYKTYDVILDVKGNAIFNKNVNLNKALYANSPEFNQETSGKELITAKWIKDIYGEDFYLMTRSDSASWTTLKINVPYEKIRGMRYLGMFINAYDNFCMTTYQKCSSPYSSVCGGKCWHTTSIMIQKMLAKDPDYVVEFSKRLPKTGVREATPLTNILTKKVANCCQHIVGWNTCSTDQPWYYTYIDEVLTINDTAASTAKGIGHQVRGYILYFIR